MRSYLVPVLVAAAAMSNPAKAAVIGDNVSCAVTGFGTFSCQQSTAQVTRFVTEFEMAAFPGNPPNRLLASFGESNNVFATEDADFDPVHLLIAVRGGLNLSETILNFKNLSALWTGFEIRAAENITGWTDSRATLVDGTFQIDLRGTQWRTGARLREGSALAIRFTQVPLSAGVPEPTSWAMMLGGFGLVGGAMRSRRLRTAMS